MRSYFFLLSLVAFFLVGPIPATSAQVREPGPTEVAANDLPSAPEPQNPAAPAYGQTAGEQSRNPTSSFNPSGGNISGTVADLNGHIVPGAVIVLEGVDTSDRQTTVADDSGSFQFGGLKAGVPYRVTVEAKGFENWRSRAVTLNPGQRFLVEDIKLKLPASVTSVTVYAYPEQIATQQVLIEEHQRVFGFIPNFYVSYDPEAVPLTTKLKFRLAYKSNTDVVTFAGVAFIAAIYQAGDIPNYGQGWDAYGKRVGAGYADTTTDVFFGGAILPWLLHQDPRYFYKGTGTTQSRVRHAMLSPFICRGDNGKQQPNYSSMGGDLISGAISNIYYPESNRGAGLLFEGFAVTTGVRMVNGLLQEFVFRKLTPSAKKRN
jgi:hypothetical protein